MARTRKAYTAEQLQFLRANCTVPINDVTAAFNAHFGTDKAKASIQAAYKNHRIRRIRKSPGKGNGIRLKYTDEQMIWLAKNYPLLSAAELASAFNDEFGTSYAVDAIKATCGRNNITSGRTGRFKNGIPPWNKGKKGYMGPNATSFTKGHVPWTKKPLYSESVDRDGYVQIIVPERNPWTGAETRSKHKHVWLWEQQHGRLPKHHAIIFADGNNRNFNPENLICVHRNVLLNLNLRDYKNQPDEVKPSILALARMEVAAGIRGVRAPGAGRRKAA